MPLNDQTKIPLHNLKPGVGPDAEKAAVIGAGFGGIAAALRLLAKGYEVDLFEATDQAGGRASVFKRDGFTFDAGPTVITAPYLFDELFTLFGEKREEHLTFSPVDPFYRVAFHSGETFDYVGEEDRIIEQIRDFNPRDVDGYKKLAAHAQSIFDIGYAQLADVPFDRLSDMFRVAPDMIKLQNYRTVYGLVSKYIKDERLRQVFTFQPLLVGGSPFRTSSIYMLIHWLERKWGVWSCKGGTGAIVQSLLDLYARHGGRLHLNSPVEHIEASANREVKSVRVKGHGEIKADIVVANADPTVVYGKMIDKKHRPAHGDGKLSRVQQSMSLFVAYFGTERPNGEKYDDIKHHTIVLGPRYKGLLDDIFKKRVLADDFSLYLHRPTITDPSLAPENSDAFYVLSPVPNQKSGLDWEKHHAEYEDRILSSLEKRLMPGLKASLKTCFSVDPRYFADKMRSPDGAAFGPEPLLRQSAAFRFKNRSEDLRGLFFVGAGTHPGAGMPGVLCSAKVLEHFIPARVKNASSAPNASGAAMEKAA